MNFHRGVAVLILALFASLGYFGYTGVTSSKTAAASYGILLTKEVAVREVEVSVWETADAIFYYLRDPSEVSKQEYSKQLRDVQEFLNRYESHLTTEQEKGALVKFKLLWKDCVARAQEILRLRDEQVSVERNAWDSVHAADDVIDYKLQATFGEGVPRLVEREKAIREVEVSIWEALNAINYYSTQQLDVPKNEYAAQLEDVDEFLGQFKALSPTTEETKHLNEFLAFWEAAKNSMNRAIQLSDLLRAKQLEFWESIHAADDVLDFKLQPLLEAERIDLDKRTTGIPSGFVLLILGILGASLSLVIACKRMPSVASH